VCPGAPFAMTKLYVTLGVVKCFRYYAGWAGKTHGKTIEVFRRLFVVYVNGRTDYTFRPTISNFVIRDMSRSEFVSVGFFSFLFLFSCVLIDFYQAQIIPWNFPRECSFILEGKKL
jgi:hypothetical protein